MLGNLKRIVNKNLNVEDVKSSQEGRGTILSEDIKKIFSEIQTKISNGLPSFDEAIDKDIVIVLGNTRSGKSTLVNYLINANLVSQRDPETKKVYISLASSGASIGHSAESHTTLPIRYTGTKILNKDLWDTPGFGDSRGPEIDIPNAFSIKTLMSKAASAKVILVSDYSELYNDNIEIFCKSLNTIVTIFPDIKLLTSSCSMVFTKVPRDVFEAVEEDSPGGDVISSVIIPTLREKLIKPDITGWFDSNENQKNAKFLISDIIKSPQRIGIFKMVHKVSKKLDHNDLDYMVIDCVNSAIPISVLKDLKIGISKSSLDFLKQSYEKISDVGDIAKECDLVVAAYEKGVHILREKILLTNNTAQLKKIKEEDILNSVIKERFDACEKALTDGFSNSYDALLALAELDQAVKDKIQESDLRERQALVSFIQEVMRNAGIGNAHEDIVRITIAKKFSPVMKSFKETVLTLEEKLGNITIEECQEALARLDEHEQKLQQELEYLQLKLTELNKSTELSTAQEVAAGVGITVVGTPVAMVAAPFAALYGAYEFGKDVIEDEPNRALKVLKGTGIALGGIIVAALSPIAALFATAPTTIKIMHEENQEVKEEKNEIIKSIKEKKLANQKMQKEKELKKEELEKAAKSKELLHKDNSSKVINYISDIQYENVALHPDSIKSLVSQFGTEGALFLIDLIGGHFEQTGDLG